MNLDFIKMIMSKNMVRWTRLKKRKKGYAEKYQMLKTRNTFAKFSLSKIKEMVMEDTSMKMDFTILEISRIAHSMVLEPNTTQMAPSKIKVNGKMENFYTNEVIYYNIYSQNYY